MTPLIQDAALALLGSGFAVTAVTAARYRRTATLRSRSIGRLEGKISESREHIGLLEEEARHAAEVRLPAMAAQLWGSTGEPASLGPLLHDQLGGTAFAQAQDLMLEQVGALTRNASERGERAAQSAVQSVTRVLQGLVYQQQLAISTMLSNHDDEQVLADANAIDHACSQLARKAQGVCILTGTWPGRQREDSPLVDVVRGGVSRIKDYRRVRITGEPTAYVSSRIVEPVVLAVAELLDNAAQHSEPGTTVDVSFVEAHNGVSVVVDDAGIGLKPEDRALAARLLSGKDPVRFTELRTPLRLGFLTIGVLAARYGFRVSVEQVSIHGGVHAVLHLDHSLLTLPAAAPQSQPHAELAGFHASEPPDAPGDYPIAPDGLPVRQRTPGAHRGPAAAPASRPPTDGGRNLAAFVRGTRSAHTAPRDEESTA